MGDSVGSAGSQPRPPTPSLLNLTIEELGPLLTHVGYGNPSGKLWFLGMEERMQGEAQEHLRWRLQCLHHPTDTITHMLQALLLQVLPSSALSHPTPTWRTMAKLTRLLVDHADDWADGGKAKDYVARYLGSETGSTFLLELLPLPAASLSDFPFTYLWRTKREYMDECLPYRTRLLRDFAAQHRPATIFCYGKGFWQHYRDTFPTMDVRTYTFPGRKTRVTVEVGRWEGSTVVLTPFFAPFLLPIRVMAPFPRLLNERLRST